MSELLSYMENGYEKLIGDGQFLMLFFVALIMLWFDTDRKEKEYIKYGLVSVTLLLFPAAAKVLSVIQSAYYDYADLWSLIPFTVLLAAGGVNATIWIEYKMKTRYGRWTPSVTRHKEKIYEIAAVAVMALLLCMCGTISLAATSKEKEEGNLYNPEIEEILQIVLGDQKEQVLLLAPDDIATFARSYSGSIQLLYGRNMWEPELNAYTYDTYDATLMGIHDWINGKMAAADDIDSEYIYQKQMLNQVSDYQCDILVLHRNQADNEILASALHATRQYEYVTETERYVVYERKD